MNLLIVIPFCSADWQSAERLLDWMFHQRSQLALGHCLVASSADTHPEMRLRVKISAEIAFENVREFTAAKPAELPAKLHFFREVAKHVGGFTRWPWLWLEPDCVTLDSEWYGQLSAAYEAQPCRYYGPHLKGKDGAFLGRTSIYPGPAINDLDTKRNFLPMSAKCRLIQHGAFKAGDDLKNIRCDAIIFHGCKDGSLIKALRPKEANGRATTPLQKVKV